MPMDVRCVHICIYLSLVVGVSEASSLVNLLVNQPQLLLLTRPLIRSLVTRLLPRNLKASQKIRHSLHSSNAHLENAQNVQKRRAQRVIRSFATTVFGGDETSSFQRDDGTKNDGTASCRGSHSAASSGHDQYRCRRIATARMGFWCRR